MRDKPPIKKRVSTLYFRDVPFDLKHQFKAWCAKRGLSMKKVLLQAMRDKLKQRI